MGGEGRTKANRQGGHPKAAPAILEGAACTAQEGTRAPPFLLFAFVSGEEELDFAPNFGFGSEKLGFWTAPPILNLG